MQHATQHGGKEGKQKSTVSRAVITTQYTKRNTTMHNFPANSVIRAQWFRLVQIHLVYFSESVNKYACLCATHFEEECYTFNPSIQSTLEGMEGIKTLNTGSVPTRHAALPPGPEVGSKERNCAYRTRVKLCEHTDNQTCTVLNLHILINIFCFNYLSEYIVQPDSKKHREQQKS